MPDKLNFDDFVEMERIDRNIGFNSVTPAAVCFKQYKKFPNYICTLKHKDKVIGYVATLPLIKTMYEKLKNDQATENDIKTEHISFNKNPCFLFIIAIVIDKPYQNAANVIRLFKNYKIHIKQLIENGMQIAEVLAECSTDKGVAMAQRFLKMKPYLYTNHGIMHSVDGQTFTNLMCH